jgi:hypothetical protein
MTVATEYCHQAMGITFSLITKYTAMGPLSSIRAIKITRFGIFIKPYNINLL